MRLKPGMAHIDMAATAPDVIRASRRLMCLRSKEGRLSPPRPEAVAINPIR